MKPEPEYWAHIERLGDDHLYFTDVGTRLFVDTIGGKLPVVRVRVRERTEEDTGHVYWGWQDTGSDRYVMIFPRELLFEMCFEYGSKEAIKRGRGRKVQLTIEALTDFTE